MGSILLKRSFFVIDTDCLSFFGNNIIEDFLFATSAKEDFFSFSEVIGSLSINLFKLAF
jgi:hypothetical protein